MASGHRTTPRVELCRRIGRTPRRKPPSMSLGLGRTARIGRGACARPRCARRLRLQAELAELTWIDRTERRILRRRPENAYCAASVLCAALSAGGTRVRPKTAQCGQGGRAVHRSCIQRRPAVRHMTRALLSHRSRMGCASHKAARHSHSSGRRSTRLPVRGPLFAQSNGRSKSCSGQCCRPTGRSAGAANKVKPLTAAQLRLAAAQSPEPSNYLQAEAVPQPRTS
jgi:hypothetical protein